MSKQPLSSNEFLDLLNRQDKEKSRIPVKPIDADFWAKNLERDLYLKERGGNIELIEKAIERAIMHIRQLNPFHPVFQKHVITFEDKSTNEQTLSLF